MENKKMKFTDITVILPSLNPDEKMIHTVHGLLQKGFQDILIVNDGSDEKHLAPFEAVAAYKEVTLLQHDKNYGKGHALKTAMQFFKKHRPASPGVITIDGDGQHHIDDICHCSQAMLDEKNKVILGCRDFHGSDIPQKSKFGNNLTRIVFRIFVGLSISDTQTGLRAIPSAFIDKMLSIQGERFEYETNMLLEMKSDGIPFSEVPIQTIYLDQNATTHFHPIRDSIKIYGVILRFAACSAISSLLELLLFTIIIVLFDFFSKDTEQVFSILIATSISRVLSSLFNYFVNRKLVFQSGSKSSLLRYALLCCAQMLVSAGLVSGFSYLLSLPPLGKTCFKAIVDTTLFFISFRIQKQWVFQKKS